MIFDSIKNCECYLGLNGKLGAAFDFIRKVVDESMPCGRYEIDGEEIYANVMEYTTNPSCDGKFEGHRKYIDVQYVVCGVETIETVEITNAETAVEYDDSCDAAFFKETVPFSTLVMNEGDFCVLYPHDLHKPGISFEGKQSEVKKIVVKIKL